MQYPRRTVDEACGLGHCLPSWQGNREELKCPDKPLGCGKAWTSAAEVAQEHSRVSNLSESAQGTHRVSYYLS